MYTMRSTTIAEPLKCALRVEIRSWKHIYCKALNHIYKAKLDHIVEFEEEISRKLNYQIKDLEDVRIAMAALESVREKQIEIDFSLGPIEVRVVLTSTDIEGCWFVRKKYAENGCSSLSPSFFNGSNPTLQHVDLSV